MIGTSEPVTGEEALSLGLVTIGAEHEEELLQKAKTLAGKFAEKARSRWLLCLSSFIQTRSILMTAA